MPYMSEQEIASLLDSLGIHYVRFTHPLVFTCEEAIRLCPKMPGEKSKNLFLRDKNGKRYFLVLTTYEKKVNIKELEEKLQVKGLGFASPERLMSVLKVSPGSVGFLALLNDTEKKASVYIDEDLLAATHISSHPGLNTSTLCVQVSDLPKFFTHTGHNWQGITL